jgi:hypothetical protein
MSAECRVKNGWLILVFILHSALFKEDVNMKTKSESTAKWLGVIVVLQVMILLSQWLKPPGAGVAQAQIPDAGAQQLEIINQLKSSNDKLDKLISILDSGKLQVKVVKPDDSKDQ